jgi:hypothetical protein
MSGNGIELSPLPKAPTMLETPNLLVQFESQPIKGPEVAPILAPSSPLQPYQPSMVTVGQCSPSATRTKSRIQARSSKEFTHAEAAVRPQNSLTHPLAHVRYKAPVHAISSVVGLKQHIAHYFHLYHTGL